MPTRCQAARGIGACWGVIAEKYRLDPASAAIRSTQQWRPESPRAAAGRAADGQLHPPRSGGPGWRSLWLGVLAVFFVLMGGGVFGLTPVRTDRWGGLPLTRAAGRRCRSCWPFRWRCWWRWAGARDCRRSRTVCVVYVELMRGVPLISRAVHGLLHVPAVPAAGQLSIDVLLRVLVGITLFAAAYMAEIVRGGLQAIPKGQHGGGRRARPELLADAAQDRPAAGAGAGGAGAS